MLLAEVIAAAVKLAVVPVYGGDISQSSAQLVEMRGDFLLFGKLVKGGK